MAITVKEHRPGTDIRDFLRVADVVFAGDPSWISPLHMELQDRLNPAKNPFFEHGEATLFTAWDGDRLVGRISAQIDHEHLRLHDDDTGFFGFFETVDDPAVATALLSSAEAWLRERGMKHMRGPFSLSINEESGLLIDGFDAPPVMMMAHSRPYQGALAEQYGLAKAKDLFAWKYLVEEPPERARKAWEQMRALPEVRFRNVDKGDMLRELRILLDIFNDAWRDNWGFVPATESEVRKMAEDMKLLLDPEIAFFVEVKGEPVAMCVCLPNLNEGIRDLGGKLFPFGFAKLLWRLKVKQPKSARLMLLGIKQHMRGKKRYGALSTAIYAELAYRGIAKGYEWAELSWTLEDNRPINLGIRAMRGKVYKTYRVYEKAIAG